MTDHVFCAPPNPDHDHDHVYLIVSKNSSPLGFQNLSPNIVYVFSIDTKSGFIYSSSIQNADVFNSIDEAKTFLSQNCKVTEMEELGNFLIGSSITNSQSLTISVIKNYKEVASINSHKIYQIINVNTVNLNFQNKKATFNKKDVDLSKSNYYFSPTLDLSMPFPYYYINQLKLNNDSFCFNRSFLSKFVENQLLIACVIVIKGYISSKEGLIYVTKFTKSKEGTPVLNSDSEKLECECELIVKKENFYYSHAWRRGPSLYLDNKNPDKLLETKNYVTKEILARFNIEKVHIFSYNSPIEKSNEELSKYFGLKELVTKELNETNILQNKSDETSSKILNNLSIPEEGSNYSLFTILDQNDEVTCIQDFIYRFISFDSLQLTDNITSAFLPKLANLIPEVSLEISQTDFLNESIQKAGDLLNSHAVTKSHRSFFSFPRPSNNEDQPDKYFSQNSDQNRKENKKFILDPQHMSINIKKIGNAHKIWFTFPEPFIVCDLYFLVYPQKKDQNKIQNNFIVYYQYQKSNIDQLTIPKVYEETWLHYDIRYKVKKSLQYDYDPVYFTPTSSFYIGLKAPDSNNESFIIKDIKIGVKRNIKNPFRFIIPAPLITNNRNRKEFIFDDEKRTIQDLITINNYFRVDNCIKNIPKNCIFAEYKSNNKPHPRNPWFYDLKFQLLSMEKNKNNCCPFCRNSLKKNYYIAEIIQNFDPILFITREINNDNNNKSDCIKICQNCGKIAGGFGQESAETESILTHYKNHKDKFKLVDNSNSISYSMKKWENSIRFNPNSNDCINLSRFYQLFGEDCNINIKLNTGKEIPSHEIQFFALVNIESIRIELNNDPNSLNDLIINVQFNQQDINDIELIRQNSTLVFENKFKPIDDISLITIQFKSKSRGSVNIKKIDIFGKLSNKPFFHPRYENQELKLFETKSTFNKNFKPSLEFTRIQHFKTSFEILKGFSLKYTDSACHSKSICFVAILKNDRIIENYYFLPNFPKDCIFSFIFDTPIEKVNDIYILYLDCAPKIDPYTVSFIDK